MTETRPTYGQRLQFRVTLANTGRFGELPVDVERFSPLVEAVLGTRVPSPGLAIGTRSPLTRGGRRALHQHLKAHPPTPLESVHDA